MSQKKFTILIVDDELINIRILSDILSPSYNIISAGTGSEAVALAVRRQPELILLDIVMPQMSGFDILKELKSIDQTRWIPVIFITSLDSHSDEVKGLLLGAVDYIKKPFANSIVKARVKTQLQLVKYMRTIETEIMLDYLMDIPNRRYFDKHLNYIWSEAATHQYEVSVMLIDIDFFKKVNDQYGHSHGDVVLQAVAAAIKGALPTPQDIVARYGGEEYGVILPHTDIQKAAAIAETIRETVANLEIIFTEAMIPTPVRVSIGVAAAKPWQDELSVPELIKKADSFLYMAKNTGRNRVCYCNVSS